MLVDRTAADVASARKRNLCAFVLAKQGANKIVGSSDPADVLVIHMDRMNPLRIDADSVPVNPSTIAPISETASRNTLISRTFRQIFY